MNLYVVRFRHFSPKDSEEGIITYLCADNDDQVYEWVKSEPTIDGLAKFNSYKDREEDGEFFNIYDDNYNVINTETFKERMIRLGGEMYDDEASVEDSYYGVTHYGWNLIKSNVSYSDILEAVEKLGIEIIDARK